MVTGIAPEVLANKGDRQEYSENSGLDKKSFEYAQKLSLIPAFFNVL